MGQATCALVTVIWIELSQHVIGGGMLKFELLAAVLMILIGMKLRRIDVIMLYPVFIKPFILVLYDVTIGLSSALIIWSFVLILLQLSALFTR